MLFEGKDECIGFGRKLIVFLDCPIYFKYGSFSRREGFFVGVHC